MIYVIAYRVYIYIDIHIYHIVLLFDINTSMSFHPPEWTLFMGTAAEISGVRWGRRRPQRGAVCRGLASGSINWFKGKHLQDSVGWSMGFSQKIWGKP